MGTNKTTTDHAAEIRQTLKKEYGWSNRKVSVRSDYFSMGSSIDVTIKSPDVLGHIVEEVAESHSRIHRCEYSGDILGGGNRYVDVRYSDECRKAMAEPFIPTVEAAIEKLKILKAEGNTNTHVDLTFVDNGALRGIEATLSWASNWGFMLWRDGEGNCTGPRDVGTDVTDIAFHLALHEQRIEAGLIKLETPERIETPEVGVDEHTAAMEAAGWLN